MGLEKDQAPARRVWNAALADYGYRITDDLDRVICEYLEKGFLDTNRLQEVVLSRTAEVARARSDQLLWDAWALYRSGFGDDQVEFVGSLKHAFAEGSPWIGVDNADQAIQILREIGEDTAANEILYHWIQAQELRGPDDLPDDRRHDGKPLLDAALGGKVKELRARNARMPSLQEALTNIAILNGWGPEDETMLYKASIDDFEQLFRTLDGGEHKRVIMRCLEFSGAHGSEQESLGVREKARSALVRIANASPLNRIRVRAYGVDADLGDATL